MKNIKKFNESHGDNLYLIINGGMHSYEAICGIYDSYEKAENSRFWENSGLEKPDKDGYSEEYFIWETKINWSCTDMWNKK